MKIYTPTKENTADIDKFLGMYGLSNLNQEIIHDLNRIILSNKIGNAIKSLPTKKSPEPEELSAELYKIFKEVLIPILLKFFHEVEGGNPSKLIL